MLIPFFLNFTIMNDNKVNDEEIQKFISENLKKVFEIRSVKYGLIREIERERDRSQNQSFFTLS